MLYRAASCSLQALKDTFLDVDRFLGTQLGSGYNSSGTTAVVMLMRDNRIWVANAGDSRAVCATRVKAAAGSDASPDKSKRASKDVAGFEPGPSGLAAKDLSIDQNPDSPGKTERGAVSRYVYAVVVRGEETPLLTRRTTIHSRPGEKERILAAGGFVSPPPPPLRAGEPAYSSRVFFDRKMTQVRG